MKSFVYPGISILAVLLSIIGIAVYPSPWGAWCNMAGTLSLFAWSLTGGVSRRTVFFQLGFLAVALGDLFMNFRLTDQYFLFGMGSFLLAYLALAVGTVPFVHRRRLWVTIPVVLTAGAVAFLLTGADLGSLFIPVAVFMIGELTLTALGLASGLRLGLMAGSLLFCDFNILCHLFCPAYKAALPVMVINTLTSLPWVTALLILAGIPAWVRRSAVSSAP